MRKLIAGLLFFVITAFTYAQTKTISGFTNETARTEFSAEEKFDSALKPETSTNG